ncbi:hypothetical protein [Microbulbifer sp. TYP-18]|uniref:hypothetical protein n=1 Tax=Microbulbifer sp. TYP-18 TaxID=3230024 RepID=UPI0034C6895E
MKKILLATLLAIVALPAFSADMVCHLSVQPGGNVFGNGTSSCFGIDFSFGNSTTGSWSIVNITKSIDRVVWTDGCSSGLSCIVNVPAYSIQRGKAYIHYDDGSIEFVEATMHYETGH